MVLICVSLTINSVELFFFFFHMSVGHLCIFFGKMSIQVFCTFFASGSLFFDTELYEVE